MYNVFSFIWLFGQAAKTQPSQGWIMGSIPVRVTSLSSNNIGAFYFSFVFYYIYDIIYVDEFYKNKEERKWLVSILRP